MGFATVRLLNDFEAIAWSLRKLEPGDIHPIGGGHAQPGAPMVVLGAGTGLGIAALLPGDRDLVIATEGGHASLPANSDREDAVIALLRRQFGRVSAERTLSGPGLQNLYRSIAVLDHVDVPARSAAEITKAALAGTCPVSKAALDMFCSMLGTVAGDLALLFRARGGIYLAGGIVPRITDYVARSEFRARFEAKGRVRAYLETIPTSVILHRDPAFLGLVSIIERERGVSTTAGLSVSACLTHCGSILAALTNGAHISISRLSRSSAALLSSVIGTEAIRSRKVLVSSMRSI